MFIKIHTDGGGESFFNLNKCDQSGLLNSVQMALESEALLEGGGSVSSKEMRCVGFWAGLVRTNENKSWFHRLENNVNSLY